MCSSTVYLITCNWMGPWVGELRLHGRSRNGRKPGQVRRAVQISGHDGSNNTLGRKVTNIWNHLTMVTPLDCLFLEPIWTLMYRYVRQWLPASDCCQATPVTNRCVMGRSALRMITNSSTRSIVRLWKLAVTSLACVRKAILAAGRDKIQYEKWCLLTLNLYQGHHL